MAESLDEFFSDGILIKSDIKSEAALICKYLTGATPLHAVAPGLVERLEARSPSTNGQYDLSEIIESVVVSVAEQLPNTHNALVSLLAALKQQQETSNFEASLSFALNERWLRYGDPDQSLSIRDETRDCWTNLNHFAALIYQARVQDLSNFAIKTLEMTLKRGGWRVNWDGPENTSDSIIALEGHASAAAHWIVVSGQHLHDESSEARVKWAQWISDLEWIAGQAELNQTIKLLCEQALVEARRIST